MPALFSDALLPFLGTALFGPDRTGYWRGCLEAAADTGAAAPSADRAQELQAEIADLERRLDRQLLNLEADDITPALRRRIAQRVEELEAAITDRRHGIAALGEQPATGAPTFAHVGPFLDRLPLLADRLLQAPHAELRALLERLQLDVVYQPAEHALDVTITLYDGGDLSQDCWVGGRPRQEPGQSSDEWCGWAGGSTCCCLPGGRCEVSLDQTDGRVLRP